MIGFVVIPYLFKTTTCMCRTNSKLLFSTQQGASLLYPTPFLGNLKIKVVKNEVFYLIFPTTRLRLSRLNDLKLYSGDSPVS